MKLNSECYYRWHYSVSNKAVGIWGNEELRREGQYRGIPRGKKAVSRGEGLLTYAWITTEMNHPTLYFKQWLSWHDLHPTPDPWRGVLLGILGGGVPPGSPNSDPISNQKMSFSTLVFRPDL